MGTVVITGGTDGIGRYLAEEFLARGDHVVVLGRDPDKGRAVSGSSGGRGTFLRVDLDSVAATRAAIARIRAEHPVVDTLVFCARYYRSRRTETVDGLEATFAHFYLSRFLFGHGLAEALARAPRPLIVNVAGPGGPLSAANLGDLQARRHYHGGAALGQGGKLNDLLGVAYAQRHPDSPVRYLLVHPGVTATAVTGSYDRVTLAMVQDMRQHAKPVAAAADPILALIDAPPAERLSAYVEGTRIAVTGPDFDPGAARALDRHTRELLAALG
ncbi:SDR family NAD(P)-dependent oxidoreductase [Nocardia thailandica]